MNHMTEIDVINNRQCLVVEAVPQTQTRTSVYSLKYSSPPLKMLNFNFINLFFQI